MSNLNQLSNAIENLLVARNLRGMKTLQPYLAKGYFLRAAKQLVKAKNTVLIGTGFPVLDTFETDGPIGAIMLYNALLKLGKSPILVCGDPLYSRLKPYFMVEKIPVNKLSQAKEHAKKLLTKHQPDLVISIERPGLARNNKYYNMRGEDISDRCACFDFVVSEASCFTLAVGDGGNEIGMGKVLDTLCVLPITPAITSCDELLVADVSNWGAHGLIALLGYWSGEDLLAKINTLDILKYISARGSVDGVTRLNTLTEDSLGSEAGQELIDELRRITGFSS